MKFSISKLARRLASAVAVATLVGAMGGSWRAASAAPSTPASPVLHPAGFAPASKPLDDAEHPAKKSTRKELTGKLNLNTASEEQLMQLPTIGPAKAERIVAWRKKNGGFKRIADLRRVKGFGYKSFKRLEPFLDIKGDTTLEAK